MYNIKGYWMKRYLFLIVGALMITAGKAFCLTESISPELEQSLKTHTNEPNFMSIVFALAFVIFLIYITGVIYSKLNLVGAKTVQDQMKNYDLSKVFVVSTTQLGQGKNLHVIELNNKRYLIGATTNSINLIKELGASEIKTKVKKAPEPTIDEAISVLYGEDEEVHEAKFETVEDFSVHKKYL